MFNMLSENINILNIIIISLFVVMVSGTFMSYKIMNKIFKSHFRIICLTLPILIYAIGAMWIPNIIDYSNLINNNLSSNVTTDWSRSNFISGAFLLSVQNLLVILLPLVLIFDKTKNIAKTMVPFALVYCIFSVTIRYLGFEIKDNEIPWYQYIFIGENTDRFFFLSNFFVIFMSIVVYNTSKTFTKWSVLGSISIFLSIIFYYLIIINIKNVTNTASGLTPGDWFASNIGSSFLSFLGPLYSIIPLSFFEVFNIWLFIILFLSAFLIFAKNVLTLSPTKISYFLEPWFYRNRILLPLLGPINALLNNLFNTLFPYGYFFPKPLKELKLKNFKFYYNHLSVTTDEFNLNDAINSLEIKLENSINKKESKTENKKNKKRGVSQSELRKKEKQELKELNKLIDNESKKMDFKKSKKMDDKKNKLIQKEVNNLKDGNISLGDIGNL